MKRLVLFTIAVATLSGCASKAPLSLSPAGVRLYQANEALLVLDTVQHSAIGLNGIMQCKVPPSTECAPLLSDRNTRLVIDTVATAVKTIKAVPDGWKATTSAALSNISKQLDASGQSKFKPYIETALTILALI